jgi:hypothetical protein
LLKIGTKRKEKKKAREITRQESQKAKKRERERVLSGRKQGNLEHMGRKNG